MGGASGTTAGGAGASGSASASGGGAAGCGGWSLDGTSTLTSVDPDGTESFAVTLAVKNDSCAAIVPTRAPVLFATSGGFAFEVLDPVVMKGSLFGLSSLEAGKAYSLPLMFVWSSPVTHAFVRLEAAGIPEVQASIPLLRKGYAAPADVPFSGDVALALQGPIETIPLSTGETWLGVVGQAVNVTSMSPSGAKPVAEVLDSSGVTLSKVPIAAAPAALVTQALAPFFGGVAVPANAASLRVTMSLALGGGTPTSLVRTAAIVASVPEVVAVPVSGAWRWDNGPAEGTYHTHDRYPEQRYAYDLLVEEAGATYAGDPGDNASYHCFGKPISAAHDGVVVFVDDTVLDNLGNAPNPMNDPPTKNGQVIVKHDDGRYSLYVHVKQGSAIVKVGDAVKAGAALAQVGNSGFTTEPHLHFEIIEIDASGRAHAVPAAPTGLVGPGGTPVVGVPKGSLVYTSP